MDSIQQLYLSFMQEYNDINSMLADSTLFYENKITIDGKVYSNSMHSVIVEHCFIHIFLSC